MEVQAQAPELLQHEDDSPDFKGIDQEYQNFKRRLIEAAKLLDQGGATE